MEVSFILGNIAALLTAISFLPQAIKTIRTKDTHSISLPMYLIFVAGVIFWLIYGFMEESVPIILCNSITIVFSGIILYYKLRETLSQP